ncbi:hypothetical protein A2348_05155 [Candidatus Uhrbacteria bacterium RIFOXYB12_FULL_58_10]|uniref:Uncharacterized protein n=1 Tax=Candidatus Uhrbacteria bacterium RIFOXYB2_FULL_57_15 TaxID=1802422 RepID=A0A1F7W4I3_9BACT|nr:MAG: hypothetical protein A2348_05155 [Candidatus Uhrbacteria bacterium RIFOXYB12_FULL_58_10]OGL97733.1 MAG: hypothetical protein A2304_00515 [Candidatus Uhrbacteria bacterium RIFOXYB2_FULL_57_15]OGM00564.1 MAG: hypothetical protein A2501_05005 [Candidatus Uhrbacteria bacterium RIFOXYC12_FULL_57_11]
MPDEYANLSKEFTMSRNVSVLPSSSTRPVALFDERGQITAMGLKAVAALQAAGLQVSEITEAEAVEVVHRATRPVANVEIVEHTVSTIALVAATVEAVAAPVVVDAARFPPPAHGKYANAPVSPRRWGPKAKVVVAPPPTPLPSRPLTKGEMEDRLRRWTSGGRR